MLMVQTLRKDTKAEPSQSLKKSMPKDAKKTQKKEEDVGVPFYDSGDLPEYVKYFPKSDRFVCKLNEVTPVIFSVPKWGNFSSAREAALEYGKKYFQVKTGRSSTRKTKASLKKQEMETKD